MQRQDESQRGTLNEVLEFFLDNTVFALYLLTGDYLYDRRYVRALEGMQNASNIKTLSATNGDLMKGMHEWQRFIELRRTIFDRSKRSIASNELESLINSSNLFPSLSPSSDPSLSQPPSHSHSQPQVHVHETETSEARTRDSLHVLEAVRPSFPSQTPLLHRLTRMRSTNSVRW